MVQTIYDKTGKAKAKIAPSESSTQVKEVQGDNILTLSFTHYANIALDVNDYTDFEGERYWLMEKYAPKQNSESEWVYDLKLYGIESIIKRFLVLETTDGNAEPVFSLTAPPRDHVKMIVKCINDGLDHTTDWKVGQVDGTDNIVIDYEGKYCDEALKEIAEKVGGKAEWWIEGQTVNICRCEHGEELTIGYGNGLTELERDTSNTAKFYTRLFPIGSTRNIDPEKYGHSRLMLPGGLQYVELHTEEYGIYDHYEQDAFSGIYPRRTGEVSSVRTETKTNDDGNPFNIYYFKDETLNFDPNEYELTNEVKRVSFQDGELAGLGTGDDHYFEVNFNSKTREFEIITIWPYDDDTQLPGGNLIPKVGDHYILWNIRMPDEYYALAEEEFRTAVDQYNAEHWQDISIYKGATDHVWIEQNKADLSIGRRVRLESEKFFPDTGYRSSRITKVTRKVVLPSQVDLEISDARQSGVLEKVNDSISALKNYTRERTSGSLPDIIRSWEDTLPTDTNLFSARRSQRESLSKKNDDTARGLITFAKGLISEMLAQLKCGATFGTGGYKFDEKGNVVVDALSSLAFDEALERGFGITKNTQGKYTLSVTDLMVWGKAVFNSLEIRKLYSVGGNVYLSGASSKLQHVVPVTNADGEVTGWKCYILSDDGTTATQNGWARYDQAKCQTFDIKEGVYENVSNTYYWRLVTDVSTENEAITETYTDADGKEQTRDLYDGKKFGWVVLSKTDCESTTNDAPKAGDTIVLDGHRMFASGDAEGRDQYNDESRTNVMMLETTGTEDGTLPRIVALTGITDYRHSDGKNEYSNTVFILSPKEVVFVSSSIKWISASGDPITFVNFRGNWAKDTEYAYYDQVSHNNAIWTCIVKKGTTTTEEPSDTSAVWRKEISGGKGEKGDKGEDGKSARRTAVVNLTSNRGTVFNGSYNNVLLRCSVEIDGKSMGGRIPRDNFTWTRDGQKILPEEDYRYRLASSSDALDLWKCSVKIPKRLLEPIELTALRADGNSLIFHASEDISKMTLYPCWKRYYRIRKVLGINNRNAWGFHDMVHDGEFHYPTPLPFTSLGDNNYSVDMSQLLSFVASHNIVLHKTAMVTTVKTALRHGKHTYWLKQGADGKYHAWGRYGVWLADSNCTPVSTVAKCKIYVETDSDTSTTGTASLSV